MLMLERAEPLASSTPLSFILERVFLRVWTKALLTVARWAVGESSEAGGSGQSAAEGVVEERSGEGVEGALEVAEGGARVVGER
ncbi:hypothetical protein CDD83_4155 [Cordyceps sp. RAO-2017]|nr:hypothetical protein CDD83_4155 [Cordyceps sp. RAO-2017]